jgi:hypothetical protein
MAAANSIVLIRPYWHAGTWAFDDPAVGLEREPFVSGMPEIITRMVRDIPNARDGFRLLFSARSFPGYQLSLTRTREDEGGYWYRADDNGEEGWLCPSLFKYFETAPPRLFAKAEGID